MNRSSGSIIELPAAAEDQAVPSHREGDLICGNGQITMLVERHIRHLMPVKILAKDIQQQ